MTDTYVVLTCPFCRTRISAMDSRSDHMSKEFMGKHLAHNHQKEMEQVLGKMEKKKSGFKKGL